MSSPNKRTIILRHLGSLGVWPRSAIFSAKRALFGKPSPSTLPDRAKLAAKQMRYFQLFGQKGAFDELAASAKRAGFELAYEDGARKVAGFRWAADGDRADFAFLVSYESANDVSVIAESRRDIFGFIMVSHSDRQNIGVEMKPSVETHEIGPNALLFRDILLSFPGFDRGADEFSRFQL